MKFTKLTLVAMLLALLVCAFAACGGDPVETEGGNDAAGDNQAEGAIVTEATPETDAETEADSENESEVESGEETDTDETDGEITPDTDAESAVIESETETSAVATDGCASFIGGGATLALLAILSGAAYATRKRH